MRYMSKERGIAGQSERLRGFLATRLFAIAILGIVAIACESEQTVRIERSYPGCLVGEDTRPASFPNPPFAKEHLAGLELEGLGSRTVVANSQQALRPDGQSKHGKRVVFKISASDKNRNLQIPMTLEELADEIGRELSRFLESRAEYPLGEGSLTDKDRVRRFGTVEISLESAEGDCTP